MKPKVIVIVGPTSSGKSALAVELARKINGEVVSADSRQVYKGLDIGTGKVTKREMKQVPHHLLDVASPKSVFTAQDFMKKARAAIVGIAKRGKVPIVAGGTGFYIDALVGRIVLPDVPRNARLRAKLEKKTTTQLLVLLKKRDPRRAKTIEPHNKRRLIRALEIAHALGKVPSSQKRELYDVLWIGIDTPFATLEKKIRARLRARMRQGMIAEAKRLWRSGLSYKRMETLGLEYRALARHLQGETSRDAMLQELEREIRRFAKRQLVYWKRNTDITWFPLSKTKPVERLARVFLAR